MGAHMCVYWLSKQNQRRTAKSLKKKQGSIQGLLQEGKRDLSMKVESVINKHEQVGICTQGAGWRAAGWKITEKNIRDQRGFLAKPI